MTDEDRQPETRMERAVRQEHELRRQNAARILAEPFGSFLVKQLAWGALGFALGVVLANLTWAVVNFVVFAGVGLAGRAYLQHRYGRGEDRADS
ncbi:hypothetical protein SAMN05660690_2711 [Geodermatophilus telluris]|uniref:Uncharacterized protein n=1 Tax=Geodermatophilus telluris TaxID=1190417 RepID=A0A1G6Q4L1_9ACTN|nr:hypothetical protein [Geodermatophilus telluris]SDC87269.1 hypothetical protein SAMN05660690_2711 [Geodermatophilus telluris]